MCPAAGRWIEGYGRLRRLISLCSTRMTSLEAIKQRSCVLRSSDKCSSATVKVRTLATIADFSALSGNVIASPSLVDD